MATAIFASSLFPFGAVLSFGDAVLADGFGMFHGPDYLEDVLTRLLAGETNYEPFLPWN